MNLLDLGRQKFHFYANFKSVHLMWKVWKCKLLIAGLVFCVMFQIRNGNRTDWSPIQSVIIRMITNRTNVQRESDLFITGMITLGGKGE